MPYLVRENLFIGNIEDAAKILQEPSDGFTHILSVVSSPSISFFSEWRSEISIPAKEIRKVYVGSSGVEDDLADMSKSGLPLGKLLYSLEYAGKDLKIVRMAIPLRDMEGENLLDYLDFSIDFIDKKRKEGSVLVHCFAGVSRSASIITAYLMKTEQLSQEAALESLRQSCEFVSPNDGFLEQLTLFEEMGFKVDRTSLVYKRFRLKVLGAAYDRGEKIESLSFGADPGVPREDEISSETGCGEKETVRTLYYRCKKCRRLIASQNNVIDHVPGEGEASFRWHKRRSGGRYFDESEDAECSSIFIEPLRWMTSVEEGGIEGKLSCANCDARLGHFNWSGVQCSCGSWITPAFQLHKSRVDMSTV